MKIAALCTSYRGVAYEWVESWSAVFRGLGVELTLIVVTGGSDLVLARCETARRGFEWYRDHVGASHLLWLDDDILPPQDPSLVRVHAEIADYMSAPVSGSFVRRNGGGAIVGSPRVGTTMLDSVGPWLVPEYTGLGCLMIPGEVFSANYEAQPLTLPDGRGTKLAFLPKFEGGHYFSEDYAYSESFHASYRAPRIGYGHYARSLATWPKTEGDARSWRQSVEHGRAAL